MSPQHVLTYLAVARGAASVMDFSRLLRLSHEQRARNVNAESKEWAKAVSLRQMLVGTSAMDSANKEGSDRRLGQLLITGLYLALLGAVLAMSKDVSEPALVLLTLAGGLILHAAPARVAFALERRLPLLQK